MAVALLLLSGCGSIQVDLSDLACGDRESCTEGFNCHPQLRVCVPQIVPRCAVPGDLCPSTIHTGDACPAPGAYIDCVEGAKRCEAGCRTCTGAKVWGACEVTSQCPGDFPLDICGVTPGNSAAQLPFTITSSGCAAASIMSSGNLQAVQCLGGGALTPAPTLAGRWQPGPVYLMSR